MSGLAEMRGGLYGLVGVCFGGLLTWMVVAPGAGGGAVGGGTTTEEMLAVQKRSEALLREIAAELPGLAATGGGAVPVVRADTGAASQEALLARLESLEETLAELTAELARGGGRGGPSVSATLVMRGGADPDVDGLVGLTERKDIDVDLQHLGWTMQQVLDTYGKPDEHYATKESIEQRWFYDMPNGALGFYFSDGRVVKVNM